MKKIQDKRILQWVSASTCKEMIHVFSNDMCSNEVSMMNADKETFTAPNTILPMLRESCDQMITAEEKLKTVQRLEQELHEKYLHLRLKALQNPLVLNGKVCFWLKKIFNWISFLFLNFWFVSCYTIISIL